MARIAFPVTSSTYTISSGVLQSSTAVDWIDDFEHNNLTNYYSGDTGAFQIVTSDTNTDSVVNEGTYSLEGDASSGSIITSRTSDGLDNYPSEGDTFKFKTYLTNSGDQPGFCWCCADEGNPGTLEDMYYVAVDNSNTNCNVWSYDSANDDYNRHIRAGYSNDRSGEWLTVYLEHRSDGDHYVELRSDDETSTYASGGPSTPNYTYTSGGVKWWFRGTGPEYWDNARVV